MWIISSRGADAPGTFVVYYDDYPVVSYPSLEFAEMHVQAHKMVECELKEGTYCVTHEAELAGDGICRFLS